MGKNGITEERALPEAFLARMRAILGDNYAAFLAASDAPPVRGLRVNPAVDAGALAGLPLRAIPGIGGAYFLDTDERVGRHPLHHAGAFYLQEPAAMLPVAAAEAEGLIPRGARACDLCAAPGGKTFQITTAIGEDGFLVSNEIVPSRCAVLAGNVERLGLDRVTVTNADPRVFGEYLPGFFDLLVVDAPCSGFGVLGKKPDLRLKSPETSAGLPQIQAEILSRSATLVRPGGRLVYSTCTIFREENEGVVEPFLAANSDFILAEKQTLFPDTDGTDGFFFAVLDRKS